MQTVFTTFILSFFQQHAVENVPGAPHKLNCVFCMITTKIQTIASVAFFLSSSELREREREREYETERTKGHLTDRC